MTAPNDTHNEWSEQAIKMPVSKVCLQDPNVDRNVKPTCGYINVENPSCGGWSLIRKRTLLRRYASVVLTRSRISSWSFAAAISIVGGKVHFELLCT